MGQQRVVGFLQACTSDGEPGEHVYRVLRPDLADLEIGAGRDVRVAAAVAPAAARAWSGIIAQLGWT